MRKDQWHLEISIVIIPVNASCYSLLGSFRFVISSINLKISFLESLSFLQLTTFVLEESNFFV